MFKHQDLQIFGLKLNYFFPHLKLWVAVALISNPVAGGQCHLIHLTILRRFSSHGLYHLAPDQV